MKRKENLADGNCGLVGCSLEMREASVRQLHRLITEGMGVSLPEVIPEGGHVWVVGPGSIAPELDVINMAGRSMVRVVGMDLTWQLADRLRQGLSDGFLPHIDFTNHCPMDVIALSIQESRNSASIPPDLIMMMRDNQLDGRDFSFFKGWQPIVGRNTVVILSGSAVEDFSVFDPEDVVSVLNDGGANLQYKQFDLGDFPDPYLFSWGHMGIVIYPADRESDIFNKADV